MYAGVKIKVKLGRLLNLKRKRMRMFLESELSSHFSRRNDIKFDKSVRAHVLTTDPESTSRVFNLFAIDAKSEGGQQAYTAFQLDFTKVQSRKCELDENDQEKSDFERWAARDLTPGPDCLMGHEQVSKLNDLSEH